MIFGMVWTTKVFSYLFVIVILPLLWVLFDILRPDPNDMKNDSKTDSEEKKHDE